MPKKVIALFRPQCWSFSNAVYIDDEEYTFDVTDLVLKMGKELAMQVRDHTYESDALWYAHPVSRKSPHRGPFEVEVEGSILAYFSEGEDRPSEASGDV